MSTRSYRVSPRLLAAPVLALAFAVSPHAGFGEEPSAVDGAAPTALKDRGPARPETKLRRDDSEAAISLDVVLDEVTASEKAALAAPGKGPLQVGFPRSIPEHFRGDLVPLLEFDEMEDGSFVAAFTVTSPRARAMRLSLAASSLPEGAEVRVFGFEQRHQVFGPFTARDLVRRGKGSTLSGAKLGKGKLETPKGPFWTPVIEGEVVGIELALPRGADPRDVELGVGQVSHLVESMLDPTTKHLADIGNSGSCNIDAACRNDERRHTAKILYTNSGGATSRCTGTLMNDIDGDSEIPFFLTANHCIGSQAEASTVNTYWNFERATCGGPNPTTVTQFTGGGELLATGSTNDFSLLQLNDQIGTYFSGWDASPLAATTPIVGIHHPSGDLKKWSGGTVIGSGSGYHVVVWSEGTTEGGSSGSGLFDGSERLRGVLSNGWASCSTPDEPDLYGRFDEAFPSLRQWLVDGASALVSGQGRNGSVAQNKWKEYKITAPWYSTQVIFELYGLSNDADLYVRAGTRPTITSYACRPYSGSTTNETCAELNNGTTTWYVGVRGYSSGTTSFTVRATIY